MDKFNAKAILNYRFQIAKRVHLIPGIISRNLMNELFVPIPTSNNIAKKLKIFFVVANCRFARVFVFSMVKIRN